MLIECVGCRRFVRDRELRCPYCDRAVEPTPVALSDSTPRRTLAAALAIAAFAGCERASSPARPVEPTASSVDVAVTTVEPSPSNPPLDAPDADELDAAQSPTLADADALDARADRPVAPRRRRPAIPVVHVAPVMVRYGCPPVPTDADV